MKINRIHIEQFGTLSDFDLDLTDGLNRISRENGWGKTTLAVFIRVMFYGFSTKGELARDRETYRPWSSGVYGGSLTFSMEDHTYTVFRVFGRSRSGSGDEFRLLDEKTRQESSRWSRNLGEELFGINEEAFANSAWIRQEGCRVTGDLAAKLGGQQNILEDMKQAEQVLAEMANRLNRLSPSRKTGLLFKMRLEKQELEAEVQRIPYLERSIRSLEEEVQAERQRLEQLELRLTETQRIQQEYSDWQEYFALKEVHDTLQREYLSRDEIWEEQQEKFPEGLPDPEEERKLFEVLSESEEQNPADDHKKRGLLLSGAGGLVLTAGILLVFSAWIPGLLVLAAGIGLLAAGIRKKSERTKQQSTEEGQMQQLLSRQREVMEAENAWKELQRADRELRAFYRKNPGFEEMAGKEMPEYLEEIPSPGALHEEVRIGNEEIRKTEAELRQTELQLNQLLQEREQLADREEQLDHLKEELDRRNKEYRITEKTLSCLKEAKEAFSGRYMETLQRSFLQYYRMLDPDQKEPLYIDAEYRICTMGGGLPRTEEVLSSGYRNLAALCLRIALLDAMYEKEPPCIILDDPFVYFDDEKYVRAMELLHRISDRYQILYLSCRNSG